MFRGASRGVFLEQLAKHHCKQFNINPDGAFCAYFVRKINKNALIQRAFDADSLSTVKSLIKREWQEVKKELLKFKNWSSDICKDRRVQLPLVFLINE
jgi:hypothetical protein